jgi:asparagine synthase (glutamine-hydrolysing)
MCGIIGIVTLDQSPIDLATLQRMNDVQRHRGPDGEGFLLSSLRSGQFESVFLDHTGRGNGCSGARVALGHRRLAILDLSERGLQPMSVPGSGVWLVFNGEIYNHRELKTELEARGASFGNRTDTEVLLQAYLHWGEACLERLEGMFAFAIWDGPRGRLFCARDRLGIKPFYYAMLSGYLLFASEVKSLVQFPGVRAEADDEAVLGFLVHGNCDYGERTVFRGVKALPAAHALSLELASGRLATRAYWRLEPRPDSTSPNHDRVDELRALLLRAISTHLISDVRAGSCLSGGLDSSTVACMVGHLLREQPEAAVAVGDSFYTFTSCWDDRTLDERDYALAVARAIGASPHLVFPSPADFWDSFPCMAWHQDMPFSSLSFYAQWRVMRAAREGGVKVLLDGQGGDEVFGGYAKFRYAYLASLLRAGRIKTMLEEAAGMMRQGDLYLLDIRKGYRYLPTQLRRLLGVDSLLRGVLRADWDRTVADESTPATRWWRSATKARSADARCTVMQEIQVDDIVMDTLPALLRMEDRSSMAFSLEARVPLLDHRVVEHGLSLPDHLKVHHGWSKFAVRRAMRGLMPDIVRLRRTKLGFAAPDRTWLLGDLRPQVTALLHEELRCQKYIDPDRVRRWYQAPGANRANTEAYLGLFRILALEMWMRAFELG